MLTLCSFESQRQSLATLLAFHDAVAAAGALPISKYIQFSMIQAQTAGPPARIFLFAFAYTGMVLGLECGADDYMVKPFNAPELSARIKAVLNRTQRSMVKSCYEGKSITIDFKSRQVEVHGQTVQLTKTEYELLELFVSYPAEVLPRKFIREQIWRDSGLYKHSRTVEVHVQRLRKKLEADPDNPRFIVTVAGVGDKYMADEAPKA